MFFAIPGSRSKYNLDQNNLRPYNISCMSDHLHHDNLIAQISEEYSDILSQSKQGVYIYLDDNHKVCNKNFSNLLGYKSEDEWAQVDTSFPTAFVVEESQETLVEAFQEAMEHAVASTNTVVWKKKDGSSVSTTVILVPVVRDGHMFALHFVTS